MIRVPPRPIAVPLFLFVLVLIITVQFTSVGNKLPETLQKFLPLYSSDAWTVAKNKYSALSEDKFTIALQTYKRPKELNDTLTVLTSEKIPSLEEIVVVWGDGEATPPTDYKSKHGTPVRFRQSGIDSLNEKLWADPAYKTQAILLSDDDVYYQPQDLEFVFQTWRKFGKNRLVGAMPRKATRNPKGKWQYSMPSTAESDNDYSMILTNLCFSHISLLDYYSSTNSLMTQIREYVDKYFNCEDIAFNFVQAHLTGEGPLLVSGLEPHVNYVPAVGISHKPGHFERRNLCVGDFEKMFGYMPLVTETGYVKRGVLPIID